MDQKVTTDYQICQSDNIFGLEEIVNHYLSLGWEIVGGAIVCLIPDNNRSSFFFIQTMIKKSIDKEED